MLMVVLTRMQTRQVDELAQSTYGLAGIVLMENAGANAARIIRERHGDRAKALICCGTGNNGGDGLVIARHLHNAGWSVVVLIAGRVESMSPDCARDDAVVQKMPIPRFVASDRTRMLACATLDQDTVVIDALLGTGFQGHVRADLAALIDRLNEAPKKSMVAIDVPSGLDCDTGIPGGVAIRADLTITFVAAKPGFFTESGRDFVGEIVIAEIGAPRELIDQIAGESSEEPRA